MKFRILVSLLVALFGVAPTTASSADNVTISGTITSLVQLPGRVTIDALLNGVSVASATTRTGVYSLQLPRNIRVDSLVITFATENAKTDQVDAFFAEWKSGARTFAEDQRLDAQIPKPFVIAGSLLDSHGQRLVPPTTFEATVSLIHPGTDSVQDVQLQDSTGMTYVGSSQESGDRLRADGSFSMLSYATPTGSSNAIAHRIRFNPTAPYLADFSRVATWTSRQIVVASDLLVRICVRSATATGILEYIGAECLESQEQEASRLAKEAQARDAAKAAADAAAKAESEKAAADKAAAAAAAREAANKAAVSAKLGKRCSTSQLGKLLKLGSTTLRCLRKKGHSTPIWLQIR